MITNEQLQEISEAAETMDMDAIWGYFDRPGGYTWFPLDLDTFEERREGFLWAVKRLIENGHVQLKWWHDKSVMSGTPDEQIDIFRQAFPTDDEGMADGIWFFDKDMCPGGTNWRWAGRDPKPFV